MNKYLLFAGKNYHPNGGWKDRIGSYETITAAIVEYKRLTNGISDLDWMHVVDITTDRIVFFEGGSA
jgi:hypothetical protein